MGLPSNKTMEKCDLWEKTDPYNARVKLIKGFCNTWTQCKSPGFAWGRKVTAGID